MSELDLLAQAFNIALREESDDDRRLVAQDIALDGMCTHCGAVTNDVCQCWNDE